MPFETFADIQKEVMKIMKEDQDKTGGLGMPVKSNPRAHIWRRISSKNSVRPSPTAPRLSRLLIHGIQVPLYLVATPREEKMFLWPEAFTEYQGKDAGIPLTA